MATRAREIVPGVYRVPLGMVNAFILDSPDGLAVIDAGTPGAEERILDAVGSIGRHTDDVRHILVTHLHGDHIGGLHALRKRTCAQVWMHSADAKPAARGLSSRPFTPASRANAIVRLAMRSQRSVAPVTVSHLIEDGDVLPVAGGVRVVHTPGHTLGHVAFLADVSGGVLFVGDAAAHMTRLGPSMLYEDEERGRQSLAKLARLDFEVACFAHGRPIVGDAAARFRARWDAVHA
jgi:glyoxylase-like metal-dependent hydrolase (beta-lactamase superfamily II)